MKVILHGTSERAVGFDEIEYVSYAVAVIIACKLMRVALLCATQRLTESCGGLFFFQAEDGIRDYKVTGVQTCALPISRAAARSPRYSRTMLTRSRAVTSWCSRIVTSVSPSVLIGSSSVTRRRSTWIEIGRAACRGRGEVSGGAVSLKKKKKEDKCRTSV